MASPRNMIHLFHYLLVARLSLWCRSILWTLNCRSGLLDDCILKGFMLKNTCGVQASVYKLPFYPISLVKSWSFAENPETSSHCSQLTCWDPPKTGRAMEDGCAVGKVQTVCVSFSLLISLGVKSEQ